MITVRKTEIIDADRLTEIYAQAREFMKNNGNPNQWRDYPKRELLEEDAELGRGYCVVEDGRIIAAFVLTSEPEKSYETIEGAWLNNLPYVTIHRLATDAQGMNVLSAAVETVYREFGDREIRLDTHPDNLPMQRSAEKNGFVRCGVIYIKDDFSDRSPRIGYQKQ